MNNDKFFKLIIGLLKSIDENTKIYKEDEMIYIDSYQPVAMTQETYAKICKELGENNIFFMGIS